jgi:hypothetical protein
MKYAVGMLFGLLLSGPPTVHQSSETFNVTIMVQEPEPTLLEEPPSKWGEVEGQEGCVIELLGGPLATWDADDVVAVLERAFSEFDGPCHAVESGLW